MRIAWIVFCCKYVYLNHSFSRLSIQISLLLKYSRKSHKYWFKYYLLKSYIVERNRKSSKSRIHHRNNIHNVTEATTPTSTKITARLWSETASTQFVEKWHIAKTILYLLYVLIMEALKHSYPLLKKGFRVVLLFLINIFNLIWIVSKETVNTSEPAIYSQQ